MNHLKEVKVLPHQMLKPNQSLEEVCSEILENNIGNKDIYVEQLNAFGKVYRHPSGRIIDISFYGLINLEKDSIKLNEENNARFEKIDKSLDLVFDHDDIIDFANKRIKRRMKYRPLGKNLLPLQFTMNELEDLYSCFWVKNLINETLDEEYLKWTFSKKLKKYNEIPEEEKQFYMNLTLKNIRIILKLVFRTIPYSIS